MKNTIRYSTLLILMLCLFLSCDEDSGSNKTLSSKYYISCEVNGTPVKLGDCIATIFTENNENSTLIMAGETNSSSNDTTWLFPAISISYPDNSVRTYSNEDILGLVYMVNFNLEMGSYFYPSFYADTMGESFILNITEIDETNQVISGNFSGNIFNSTTGVLANIENGVIYAKINQTPQ